MECPVCGQPMDETERDSSSGSDMRSYYCATCRQEHILDIGTAFWQVLHRASEPDDPAARPG
jgi:hypothetical protein